LSTKKLIFFKLSLLTVSLMVKVSREFISEVAEDSSQQEALGYKNALRVFGKGAVLEREIKVFCQM